MSNISLNLTQDSYTKEQTETLITSSVDQAIAKFKRTNSRGEDFPDMINGRKGYKADIHEKSVVMGEYFRAVDLQRNGKRSDVEKALSSIQNRFGKDYYDADTSIEEATTRIENAAFSEASGGAGQYTVPSFWSDQIWNTVEKFGFARRLATVMPMPGLTVNLTSGTSVSVSYPGNNVSATPFDATNFFQQTVMTAVTAQAIQIIQLELEQDTAVPILGYLTDQVAMAFAKSEDLNFFNGSGSGNTTPLTGILNTSGINAVYMGGANNAGKTTLGGMDWTDVVNLYASLNTLTQEGAAFFCTQSVWSAMHKFATANRPVWEFGQPISLVEQEGVSVITGQKIKPPQSQGWHPFGVPVFVIGAGVLPAVAASGSLAANTPIMICGNPKYGVLGDRLAITTRTFDQQVAGVDVAGQRQIGLVTYERYSVAFPVPSAFSALLSDIS